MVSKNYDVIVVGGGVGGYPAAIKLIQHGYKVALIEEHLLGGECTNYGCIPSKALYRIAHSLDSLTSIIGRSIGVGWNVLREWVESIVSGTRDGIAYLLEKYGVDVINDRAKLSSAEGIIKLSNGEELKAKNIVLALGTNPKPLPNVGFDGSNIVSNREIFYLDEMPSSIAIIGGGAIGVELAYILSSIGIDVYLVEALKRLLPMMDSDVGRVIERFLVSKGIKVFKNTLATSINRSSDGGIEITLSNGSRFTVDKVLVSIGRIPRTKGVGLENANVETNGYGYIRLYDGYRTSNPRIYASGDVIGPPLLAQKAIIESILVADSIMGKDVNRLEPEKIPLVVFSGLEIGSIGFSEEQLRAKGIKYRRYKIPLSFLSAIRIKDGRYGFVKALIGEDDKFYGLHIVAPNASEVVSSFLPIYLGKIAIDEAAYTPYPHVTVSEAVRDFAEYILGEPIHMFIRK